MKKITLSLLLIGFCNYGNAQCNEPFSVPHFSTIENASVPNLPDCMTSNYIAFTSNEVFESIAGPVAGFTGKLLSYDTYTGNPDGGAMSPTIGADLTTNNIVLQQGVQYVITYRYGISDPTKTIGRFGIRLQRPSANYYDDISTHLNITGATVTNYISEAFTVPATGEYYINFDVQSFENRGIFYLDDITVQVASAMGTGENLLSDIVAYPNPTSGKLAISNQTGIDKVAVYSLTGQLLCSEPANTLLHEIDMGNFATGMYMLHVYSGKEIKTMKIYKE